MAIISHDSETPAHGQQVITACAFIHHNFDGVEKVFMPKRAATKKFLPNVYELPGGHIEYGEDIVSGLGREITEELGMTITVGDPFAVFTYVNHIKGSHSVEIIYFAKFNEPIDAIALHPEDHSEYGWFAAAELHRAASENKPLEDIEMQMIQRGFELMNGESLNFGGTHV